MPLLHALAFAALDPVGLARFWAGVLGRRVTDDGLTLLPGDDAGFRLQFLPTQEPKSGPNQMHFDLTSTSLDDQRRTVARALERGARHLDIGQGDVAHVVLADPEGNEFDVIEPGNRFLAGCGFIGALSSDGSQEVGYFWSRALGWPLVWDQDQETAIQSPHGGTKVTWGGPPVRPKTGKNRMHFDLAPPAGDDQQAEVDRLVSLGAARLAVNEDGVVQLRDPDRHEFSVRAG